MTDLLIAGALDTLRGLVGASDIARPEQIAQQLRALQRMGLSKQDLVVHLERLRAHNDVTSADEQVEDNALLALDIVGGLTPHGLSWDAAEKAASWVPLALTRENFDAGAAHALTTNDLLPPRSEEGADSIRSSLVDSYWHDLERRTYKPTTADFFRAPKPGLTTRPAALLAPRDQFVYEGLAESIAHRLESVLPAHVVWPRSRDADGTHSDFVNAPKLWSTDYVLRTDVASFYESIDHAYLSVLIARQLSIRGSLPVALEAFLDAIMRTHTGLPQGLKGSDVFASAYLVDIDRELDRRGWPIARYSDDLLIGAASFEEARARLRELEAILRERGLTLAGDKTRIMKRRAYLSNLEAENGQESLRERVRERVILWLEDHPEEGLDTVELPEPVEWDVMYRESIPWEDVLDDVSDQLLPPWIRAYESIFDAEARRLVRGGHPFAADALSLSELRSCLVFMTAGAQVAGILPDSLMSAQVMLDWQPSLVREISALLSAVAERSPEIVRDFLTTRLSRDGDSDLESAWLLSPAVSQARLATLLRPVLTAMLGERSKPLSAAAAFRALERVGSVTRDRDVPRHLSAALRAELALSLDWSHRGRQSTPELEG